MRITVNYEAQAKRAAGVRSETVEVGGAASAADVIRTVAEQRRDSLGSILLNATNQVQQSLLLFVGDQQIADAETTAMSDGDSLTIMTPLSGG